MLGSKLRELFQIGKDQGKDLVPNYENTEYQQVYHQGFNVLSPGSLARAIDTGTLSNKI